MLYVLDIIAVLFTYRHLSNGPRFFSILPMSKKAGVTDEQDTHRHNGFRPACAWMILPNELSCTMSHKRWSQRPVALGTC